MKSLTRYLLGAAPTLLALSLSQAQAICSNSILSSTPDARYFTEVDGTVTDSATGLMWQRCSFGQTWDGSTCSGSITSLSWSEALTAAEADNSHTFSDWRLPDIKELGSLVETRCWNPSINEGWFPNTASWSYWSSSVVDFSDGITLTINFDVGGNGRSSGDLHVRLVRAGQ